MEASEEFRNASSFFGVWGHAPLDLSYGYAVILGFGAAFALLASAVTGLNVKYNNESRSSEEFNTAGRSLGIGLTGITMCVHK